jgi:hypothetical protein
MRWAGNEPPMQDPLSPARKFPLRDSEWLPYVLSTDRKLSRNPNPNRTEQFNSFSPDGKRLLMIQRDPASVPRQLNVILNWADELDRPPAENR